MSNLAWFSWGAWLLVVVAGGLFRSRAYAVFRAVTLGLHTLIALPLLSCLPEELSSLAAVLHGLVYVESLVLIRPAMRPAWYRIFVSWPALTVAASTLLAWPWAVVASLGWKPWGLWLPYAVGLLGFVQSVTTRREQRRIVVGSVEGPERVERLAMQGHEMGDAPVASGGGGQEQRTLRLVQITDPHLGPWMSVTRLSKIARRAVVEQPDLILLTGDYLTMESQADARYLAEALSPLREAECPVVACLGNHDHEALPRVRRALEAVGARLLVDEEFLAQTPAGAVQILGFDFHFRDRAERTAAVLRAFPRRRHALRLALLHDPGAFRHVPPGDVDLVLSGHTHGGQVGLVSLGGSWTVAGWVAKIPDHGLWGHGSSRLYVHRGTGHYGFPLRLGVPAEESVLTVVWSEGAERLSW